MKQIVAAMLKQHARKVLSATIMAVTLGLLIRFLLVHPDYLVAVRRVSLPTVIGIIALNALLTIVLAVVYQFVLFLCGQHIAFREQLLLTAYASLANFLGPLQSGPAIRMVYLKSRHQVNLKSYAVALSIYYGFFALISCAFIAAPHVPFWLSGSGGLLLVVLIFELARWYQKWERRRHQFELHVSLQYLAGLFLATFIQIAIVTSYYAMELHAVGIHASTVQLLSYTGISNLALFASLTPDAIGIRESFLLFSKSIHHFSTAAIVTANILDRAVYLLFLAIMFIIVLAAHGRQRLAMYRVGH
ncbi:MAG: hypothetical protein NVS1B7_7420 [Candidatus Saccharimonadales bacterium]